MLSVSDGIDVSLPAYDGNGNIMAYTDAATGAQVAVFEYDPFGRLLRESGPRSGKLKFRFSSKVQDPKTGHYYYGLRYYSPELGRWINRDLIQEGDGLNVYGFAINDGINFVDLDGRRRGPPWGNHQPGQSLRLTDARRLLGFPFDILSGDGFGAQPEIYFNDTQCEFLVTVTGIFTDFEGNEDFMNQISSIKPFDQIPNPIFVHNPTFLYLGDLIQIIGDTFKNVGVVSARMANVLRLAHEQGLENCCTEECVNITVVAHSQGAAIANHAFALLDPEIRDNINFIGMGGQHYVDERSLRSFRNIENRHDIVPRLPNQLTTRGGAEVFAPDEVGLGQTETGPISGHTLGNEGSGGSTSGAYYEYLRQNPPPVHLNNPCEIHAAAQEDI